MIQTKNLPGRGPATRSIVAVSRLVALSAVIHLSVITPVSPATRLEAAQAEDTVTVFGHPVYIFEFSDAGFTPSTLRTSPGTAAIFIRNLTMFSQNFTVTRKRPGKKKKVLFAGAPIAGQSITGTTKFRSGDVYTLKETNSGQQVKITVE